MGTKSVLLGGDFIQENQAVVTVEAFGGLKLEDTIGRNFEFRSPASKYPKLEGYTSALIILGSIEGLIIEDGMPIPEEFARVLGKSQGPFPPSIEIVSSAV